MKKLVYHPVFRNLLIEPIVEKKKEKENKLILTTTEEEIRPIFSKVKVIDYAKDCLIFKSFMSGQDRFVIVQTHLIEKIEIDGEILHLIPETAVVMISSEIM